DGVNVKPVMVDEFRFGPGETYDVLVEPTAEAYTLFAQSMDRTGYARGTLATRKGLSTIVPPLDEPQALTMADMMGNMDHGAMNGMDHSAMNDMASMDHAAMTSSLAAASKEVRHARTEYGPSVDMRVEMPRTNLDDPGVGLRNNGRRVLTLADLRTPSGPMDPRPPEREIELHL
ncbi:copper resistance system multicopper oxidase, partial [Vibrio parahaemolyticus]|nr:copper resistance system multicopper oxidase [Vibrio parahaemolyticus]